jgi:hypothetical protein
VTGFLIKHENFIRLEFLLVGLGAGICGTFCKESRMVPEVEKVRHLLSGRRKNNMRFIDL